MARFPYATIYAITGNELRIYAAIHQSRHPTYWRGRKTTPQSWRENYCDVDSVLLDKHEKNLCTPMRFQPLAHHIVDTSLPALTGRAQRSQHVEQEFGKFRVLDDQRFESDFDRMVKQLPSRTPEKKD